MHYPAGTVCMRRRQTFYRTRSYTQMSISASASVHLRTFPYCARICAQSIYSAACSVHMPGSRHVTSISYPLFACLPFRFASRLLLVFILNFIFVNSSCPVLYVTHLFVNDMYSLPFSPASDSMLYYFCGANSRPPLSLAVAAA